MSKHVACLRKHMGRSKRNIQQTEREREKGERVWGELERVWARAGRWLNIPENQKNKSHDGLFLDRQGEKAIRALWT